MAQESEDGILGYLPHPKESQHMVDAYGIEILLHPTETTTEPLLHAFAPAIGGKAPVLTILREVIRWCTRRTVEVEERWMSGSLHTLAIHANGYVALQNDALGTGIVGCRLQLTVEMILEIVDSSLARIASITRFTRVASNPFCIGLQPILIL